MDESQAVASVGLFPLESRGSPLTCFSALFPTPSATSTLTAASGSLHCVPVRETPGVETDYPKENILRMGRLRGCKSRGTGSLKGLEVWVLRERPESWRKGKEWRLAGREAEM